MGTRIQVRRGVVVDRITIDGTLFAVIHETGRVIEEHRSNVAPTFESFNRDGRAVRMTVPE